MRRLVADAQSREAPVQRLADRVAGRFCYGIMAASAATFGFWSLAGTSWFPDALGACCCPCFPLDACCSLPQLGVRATTGLHALCSQTPWMLWGPRHRCC